MKKKCNVVVVVALLATVACGGPNLEKSLTALENKAAPANAEEAKARLGELAEFQQGLDDYRDSGGEVPTGLVARAGALKLKLEAQKGFAELKEGKLWAKVKNFFGFGEKVSEAELERALTPAEREKKRREKLEQEDLEYDVDLSGKRPFNKERWP